MDPLFDAFTAVVLNVTEIIRINGSIEALPCVQCNLVFVPGTYNTHATMRVLRNRNICFFIYFWAGQELTSMSPNDSGPPVSVVLVKLITGKGNKALTVAEMIQGVDLVIDVKQGYDPVRQPDS